MQKHLSRIIQEFELIPKSIRGHKFINFVLFLDGEIVPLSTLAHYSREFCENNGYTYKTENDLVIEWLNWLHASGLFPKDDIKHLNFVCDAGYDAKKVQKAINRIGCHFGRKNEAKGISRANGAER
ncbi:hypothetical protein [Oligoflexus tunisiensis]|uniref:hypothetical protein n=1 Tax=Oligoflexus tunisiensis TaxID=708132 RepID=UPI00114CA88D|nr:hypothetical protein [Oligoflexus tunisiensis]